MSLVVIRHKVKDFAVWKKAYDAHASARVASGLSKGRVTRSADDPNEVVMLFEVADLAKAKAFGASDELKSAMQGAGVTDKPDLYFLNDAG